MDNLPALQDLRLFCFVARRASFSAAAREAGTSQTLMSKRVGMLEKALGVKLLRRTTRRVSVTDEGAKVFTWAQQILGDVEEMRDDIARGVGDTGPIRIARARGWGARSLRRRYHGLQRYPAMDVWLELLDRRVDLIGESFHLDIRAGEVTEQNRSVTSSPRTRILCAAPSYLKQHGAPNTPADLANHECVLLREREAPFGTWVLAGPAAGQSAR
jgi:LysR family transcriptional activator of dmlA